MTPPGNGERPPRRLTLVQPADSNAARDVAPAEPTTPSSPPASIRPSLTTLPPRSADLAGLSRLLAGQAASVNNHQLMQSYLAELANPTPNRGYDFSLDIAPNRYQITQTAPGEPIEVTVTKPPASGSSTAGDAMTVITMTYLPDGRFHSSQGRTPHPAPRRGSESFFHDTLTGRLSENAVRIFQGGQLFIKMESALQALEGRFVPDSQSIWHDHLVAHGGRVYSFRRMSFLGMNGIQNPQHNQISIFEETGSAQVRVATISANGEVEYAAGRGGREPPNVRLLELLNHLVPPLEDAKVDPVAYQARLHQALESMPQFRGIQPTLRRSVDIPRDFSLGSTPRGHVQDFNHGWQLFRHLRSARQWRNPANPAESAALRPPWRLSRAMSWEMLRWGSQTAGWFLMQSFSNPRPNTDHLRLHLFPEGGGQLSIYRNQELHNIVTAGPEGPAWYADQEIRQMRREGITFANHFEALQAALARRGQGAASPFILQVQQAPELDLSRLHVGSNGESLSIRNVSEAWTRIERLIPPGIEYRVDPRIEQTVVNSLIATSAEPDRIIVDFPQSQPAMQLDIQEQRIRMGDREVPRVNIFVKRGDNAFARVYENGVLREDLARDVHQESLRQAQEGTMRRNIFARGGQGFLRAFTHVRGSGFTYGASHFISLPLILGIERLMLNPTERRLIGTPGLEANLSPSYLGRNVALPFGYMAIGSGLGTLAVDGAYNSRRGIWNAIRNYRGTEATFSQAWRDARPSFYNGSPFARPVSPSFLFRGFLQRATPLFGALLVFDVGQHGSLFSASNWGDTLSSARFWRQVRDVGLVSAGSAALLRGIQASSSLSSGMVRLGLFADGTTAAGARLGLSASGARFGLTFRGGIALAVLEMTALGILSARERRQQLQQAGEALRSDLGHAIDRRNEVISRLEMGEEVEPRHLFAADARVQEAQAAYRRFLELTERTEGHGNPRELGMGNDFASEEQRYRSLRATTTDPMALTHLESEHSRRLTELRSRYEHMEAELDQLYARYGAARSVAGEGHESLRDFLARQAQTLSANPDLAHQAAEAAGPPAPVQPPVSVESSDGQIIVDQLRWKAAQEPGFILWSRERRADYILREFRGYTVSDGNGGQRSWNQAEALAFLDAVDAANIRRIHNLEAPLTMPTEGRDGLRTASLQELLSSEQAIRAREAASHGHVSTHTAALADNVADLDRQMEAYYRMTNERSAAALSQFLPANTVALAQ